MSQNTILCTILLLFSECTRYLKKNREVIFLWPFLHICLRSLVDRNSAILHINVAFQRSPLGPNATIRLCFSIRAESNNHLWLVVMLHHRAKQGHRQATEISLSSTRVVNALRSGHNRQHLTDDIIFSSHHLPFLC